MLWQTRLAALPIFAVTLSLLACGKPKQTGKPIPDEAPVPDAYGYVVDLKQGWTNDTQRAFYDTPQGSEIMPYGWLLALEQAGNDKRFLDPANIDRFRYLPRKPSKSNPDGLPVGWTRGNDSSGKAWFGLTCAACHTTQINYTLPSTKQTIEFQVDGAPTLADFSRMALDLVAALRATAHNADKFDRFAKVVLRGNDNENTRAALRGELEQVTASLHTRNEINKTPVEYGFGRIDAIGFIFNQTMSTLPSMPQNAKPSDAPASYPFLWGTGQSNVVQWTGFAPNGPRGAGALVRNGGEVVGVFGKVELTDKETYASSLKLENLGELENWLDELRAPVWPENILPKIDKDKAALGKPLYAKLCARCHVVVAPEDQAKAYNTVVTPIGEINTDPTELNNMLQREYDAGLYAGKKGSVIAGETIPSRTTALDALTNAVIGSLLHRNKETLEALIAEHAIETGKAIKNVTGYKGRPLNGIWATAPFLHNGSVPNLYELLLPAAERSQSFTLGSREFDPVKVGFTMDQPATAEAYAPFNFDTTLKGNSNAGHEYFGDGGAPLSEEERWQLVEYMKTL